MFSNRETRTDMVRKRVFEKRREISAELADGGRGTNLYPRDRVPTPRAAEWPYSVCSFLIIIIIIIILIKPRVTRTW